MDSDQMHPLAMSGKDPSILRGDPIPKERYFSKEFMPYEIGYISKSEKKINTDTIGIKFMIENIVFQKIKSVIFIS